MFKINLVDDNRPFFRQLKEKAIAKGIELTIKWAKITVILGLKAYLQIEDE